MSWTRYVAVGDSFTEGLQDPGDGQRHRGWADRLAEGLARSVDGLEYANLAIRGKKLPAIVTEQVPAALDLHPDLISIAGGVNDALRPRWSLEEMTVLLESGVDAARSRGSDVLIVAFGSPSRRSRAMSVIETRLREYREVVLRTADKYSCFVMDLWPARVFDDARLWDSDRLHLNELGHDRVANAALEALGLPATDWRAPLPPADSPSVVDQARDDARWIAQHFAPWVARHVMGKSSGDGITPKRAHAEPLTSSSANEQTQLL